jgi:uncharacterized protein YlzI (FlbEa/FlbD family)
MGVLVLAAVQLITLNSLDGRAVLVNPRHVTQLREAREEGDPDKQMTGRARCVIRLTDGSFVTVAEDCGEVRKLMEGAEP